MGRVEIVKTAVMHLPAALLRSVSLINLSVTRPSSITPAAVIKALQQHVLLV